MRHKMNRVYFMIHKSARSKKTQFFLEANRIMNIFEYHKGLIGDFSSYIDGFISIKDERIRKVVDDCLEDGTLWPDPLIQLNPSFEMEKSIEIPSLKL